MKKQISLLLIIFLSQFTFAQFDGYEKATSNQELIDLLEKDAEMFEDYINLFLPGKQPSNPREVKPLKLKFDKNEIDNKITEYSHVNWTISNIIDNKKNEIYIHKDPNIYDSNGDIDAEIIPTKIIYHDDSWEAPTKKIALNTNFSNDLNLKKAVKQIDVEFIFKTTKNLDSIVIPIKNKQTVKDKNFTFELISHNNQSVTIKTNATSLDFFEVQGITSNNQRISKYGSSQLSTPPDVFETKNRLFLKKINEVIKNSKKDISMNSEKFKNKFFQNLEKLKEESENLFTENNGNIYLSYDFGFPITELVLYYKSEIYEQKISKTFVVKNKSNYLFDYDSNENLLIYDLNLKPLKTFDKSYFSLNERFFEGENQYFHLDDKDLKMKPLLFYKIENLTNNFVLAQEDDDSDFELLNGNNDKLMIVDLFEFDKDFDVALLQSNEKFYLINCTSNQPIEIKNAEKVSYAEKGFFVVTVNEKKGFVDSNGKTIVPCEYEDVISFDDYVDLTYQDYLFGVKKNGKWGFVNSENKIIIPFEFSKLLGPFSYGIAPVYIDGKLGLINLKNEKLSRFKGSSYSSSSNFGKRAINLSDGNYNYKGELENK